MNEIVGRFVNKYIYAYMRLIKENRVVDKGINRKYSKSLKKIKNLKYKVIENIKLNQTKPKSFWSCEFQFDNNWLDLI